MVLVVRLCKCVELDKNWSKGHVRLACAYIANHQSNDACNSLQRAIQLDPTNSTMARQLLREQLLQRNTTTPSAPPMEDEVKPPTPSAPPMEEETLPTAGFYTTNNNNNYASYTSSSYETSNQNNNADPSEDREEEPVPNNNNSWMETIQMRVSNTMTYLTMKLHDTYSYYQNLSPDGKTLVQVLIGFVLIYIAFGGRFGLTTSSSSKQYTSSQYSSNHQQQQQRYSNERSRNNQQYHTHSNYHNDDDDHYHYQQRTNYYASSSYQFHLFDGSLPSMVILGIVGYVCHVYFGINPAHAIYLLRLLTSTRGGRMRRQHGYGGGFRGGYHHAGYRPHNMFRR